MEIVKSKKGEESQIRIIAKGEIFEEKKLKSATYRLNIN